MLWNTNKNETSTRSNKLSYKKTIAILACLFVIIGGGISLLASSNPDGLEWSIEKITGDTEIESSDTSIYETTEQIQDATSILPDYAFKNSDSTVGTSVSGIVGCGITVLVLLIIGYIIKLTRKKEATLNE